ncbi:DNA repair protein RecN [candidate division WOR-3 bacterium]|uniref:DNA repair protein RecN n=1 Tax=candidate division WOR-3 bacterium TaxID=2052148 RepID=A0A938BS47_UNCW3|nr:DNA repair protein RecN [candidate division WOR-3 bacterium]
MLSELRIRNYALIEDLTVQFSPGLNVLSGETGAGKSIIIGALSLLLGDKPDADMIRAGADTAQVEGRFDAGKQLAAECTALGIPLTEDGALLLRRRAERSGRGAAYANDSGITIAALQRLGDRLVDLHGQHQHQLLLKPEIHLDILDEYAGLSSERDGFAERFHAFDEKSAELARLDQQLAERRSRQELTEFQLKELGGAAVKSGELAGLSRERELLQSAERRFTLARQLEELLSEQEGSIIGLLGIAGKTLNELAELDPGLAERRALLSEARAGADDLWRELVRYRESIEFSPERMEEVNSRLFLIEKLERKYGLRADELASLEARLRAELDSIELGASHREEMVAELSALRQDLMARADALSRKRGRARTELEKRLSTEFEALGLGKAVLSVSIGRVLDPDGVHQRGNERFRMTPAGVDTAEFLFSANPGEELRPLRKVASGGELSRIMLALKSALTRARDMTEMSDISDRVPSGGVATLVFDEIDVGIGGKVAEAVGKRLARLGKNHQVICITHLPQIAKYAERHLLVAKSVRGNRTLTSIRTLDPDSRVEELARMTSGATVTKASLAHAREMLESTGSLRE